MTKRALAARECRSSPAWWRRRRLGVKRALDEESQGHNLCVSPVKGNINTTNGSSPDYTPTLCRLPHRDCLAESSHPFYEAEVIRRNTIRIPEFCNRREAESTYVDHQGRNRRKWGNCNERNKGQVQTSFVTCGAVGGRHTAVVVTVRCGNTDDVWDIGLAVGADIRIRINRQTPPPKRWSYRACMASSLVYRQSHGGCRILGRRLSRCHQASSDWKK